MKAKPAYRLSNVRLTSIGDEVYLDYSDLPIRFGFTQKNVRGKRDAQVLKDEEACIRRSRKRMRDIIKANAGQYGNESGGIIPVYLLTLTIAENIQDTAVVNKKFHAFIKRYCYLTQAKLKYLAVIEYQKRGAIHYHVLFFNLPYLPDIHEATADCWREGFIFGTSQGDIRKVTNYLLKYVQKSIGTDQAHQKNKRRFLTSKGLLHPVSTLDENAIRDVMQKLPKPISIRHATFIDHEGRTTNRDILEMPKGFNAGRFVLQDTAKLAKEIGI